jgi:hypothetical protein
VDGKDFLVVVKKKSKQYKDYEECKFLEQVTPFRFFINGQKHIVTTEELQETAGGKDTEIAKFLRENTPNRDKYNYRPWTEDTYKQVAAYIKAIIPYREFMQEILDDCRDDKIKQLLLQITTSPVMPTNAAPGYTQGLSQPVQEAAPVAQAQQPMQATVTPIAQAPVKPAATEQVVTPQPQPQQNIPVVPENAPAVKPAAVNESNEFDSMLNSL